MYIVNKSDTTYIVGNVMVKGETVQYVSDADAVPFLADAVVAKRMEEGWIQTLTSKPDPSEYLNFTIIDELGQTEGYGVCYRCGSFTRLRDGVHVNSGGGGTLDGNVYYSADTLVIEDPDSGYTGTGAWSIP